MIIVITSMSHSLSSPLRKIKSNSSGKWLIIRIYSGRNTSLLTNRFLSAAVRTLLTDRFLSAAIRPRPKKTLSDVRDAFKVEENPRQIEWFRRRSEITLIFPRCLTEHSLQIVHGLGSLLTSPWCYILLWLSELSWIIISCNIICHRVIRGKISKTSADAILHY